jgi:hypothetical protein
MSENKLKNIEWAEIPAILGAVTVSSIWLGLVVLAGILVISLTGTFVYFLASRKYSFSLTDGVRKRKNVRYSSTPHIRK